MKKRPTPFEKPSALEPRSNHNTDDLFSGLLPAAPAPILPRPGTVKDAALDACAQAPRRRGLGLVAPEQPARQALEGEQLAVAIGAAGHVLLEGIHVLEGMVERPLGPQRHHLQVQPQAPLATHRRQAELGVDRVGLLTPVHRRLADVAVDVQVDVAALEALVVVKVENGYFKSLIPKPSSQPADRVIPGFVPA